MKLKSFTLPKSSTLLVVLLQLIIAATNSGTVSAYDIGCLYPENMPTPYDAQFALAEFLSAVAIAGGNETPISVHRSHVTALCNANCLAYHDEDVLNAITEQPTTFTVPPFGRNAFSIMMCIAQCYSVMVPNLGAFWEAWGIDVTSLSPQVVTAVTAAPTDGGESLTQLLVVEDFHPLIVGQIVLIEILALLEEDGWNSLGKFVHSPSADGAVECTANCVPYADTSGYAPVKGPQRFTNRKKFDKANKKYKCKKNCRRWRPLLEGLPNGSFQRQDHVTPHIGHAAHTYVLKGDFKSVKDPEYDYFDEAQLVIERVRETVSDPIRKETIRFMDNKLFVRALIQDRIKQQFSTRHSFQDQILFIYGLSAGEHDATVQAWREKVHHDLVRPTTYIKQWDDDVLVTFGGDKAATAPVEIRARDFEAFQRVMPHSEFPSGSACLCTSYAEFADRYTMEKHGAKLRRLRYGPNDFNALCQIDFVPKEQKLGCTDDNQMQFDDMADLANQCGQSRLWGGMHFTASVAAGEELCSGIGTLSFELVEKIRNGSDFGASSGGGGPWFEGDSRPVCGTP